MDLQHDSWPFLPLASCFMTFWLGHVLESKFWVSFWRRKWPTSFGFLIFEIFFFRLSFFSFSFLSAIVIDLLLGLLSVKKLARKRHRDRQFLRWSSQVLVAGNFALCFSLNFLSTICAYLVHISGSIRDDVGSERKAEWLWAAQESMG